jgi:hypothetical protein
VSLADWDAPYRSAQECPFVYGMLKAAGACQTRDRVRGKSGGGIEDVGIEFEVNRTRGRRIIYKSRTSIIIRRKLNKRSNAVDNGDEGESRRE